MGKSFSIVFLIRPGISNLTVSIGFFPVLLPTPKLYHLGGKDTADEVQDKTPKVNDLTSKNPRNMPYYNEPKVNELFSFP